MSGCPHMNFEATVNVARLEDVGKFHADVRIKCADCETPFEFHGLPLGIDLNGAAMSVDAQEARLAITPFGQKLAPLDNLVGFNIKGHN